MITELHATSCNQTAAQNHHEAKHQIPNNGPKAPYSDSRKFAAVESASGETSVLASVTEGEISKWKAMLTKQPNDMYRRLQPASAINRYKPKQSLLRLTRQTAIHPHNLKAKIARRANSKGRFRQGCFKP